MGQVRSDIRVEPYSVPAGLIGMSSCEEAKMGHFYFAVTTWNTAYQSCHT